MHVDRRRTCASDSAIVTLRKVGAPSMRWINSRLQ